MKRKISTLVLLLLFLCPARVALGQGKKYSDYPTSTTLGSADLLLFATPGVTNKTITGTNLFSQIILLLQVNPNGIVITNVLEVKGQIKGGSLIITNDVTFYNNTYVSNVFVTAGVVTNNFTVFGSTALNTATALTLNVTNALTINGVSVATFAGITNVYTFALSDMTTAITTGTNKNYWYAPSAGMTVKFVRATLATASSSGTPTFDINEAGTSILSTKITIDANEWDSFTAATPPVISDSTIAANAKVDFDIDVAGTAAAGAQIQIGFTVP